MEEEKGRNTAEVKSDVDSRKRYVLHLIITFVVFIVAIYFFLKPTVKKGDTAPDFKLIDINGAEVNLSDFRGNIVFLNFWATWCPPCIEELPQIQALSEQMVKDNFIVLAVNIDQISGAQIKQFVQERGLTFRVLLDPKSSVGADKYGITGVPETFLIDKNGKIIDRFIGPRDWTTDAFIEIFKKIINSAS
ncbi:MAG TPA: TlpA disulfide reductase family protein [bacterium]